MGKRVSVVNNDNGTMDVFVDGVVYFSVPTTLPETVHAIQWYGDHGVIEHVDRNENTQDFSMCASAVDAALNSSQEPAEPDVEPDAEPNKKPENLTPEEYAREIRGGMLDASDWVVARATELGETVPTKWQEYRKALRDVPLQDGFPDNVDWPTPPSSYDA